MESIVWTLNWSQVLPLAIGQLNDSAQTCLRQHLNFNLKSSKALESLLLLPRSRRCHCFSVSLCRTLSDGRMQLAIAFPAFFTSLLFIAFHHYVRRLFIWASLTSLSLCFVHPNKMVAILDSLLIYIYAKGKTARRNRLLSSRRISITLTMLTGHDTALRPLRGARLREAPLFTGQRRNPNKTTIIQLRIILLPSTSRAIVISLPSNCALPTNKQINRRCERLLNISQRAFHFAAFFAWQAGKQRGSSSLHESHGEHSRVYKVSKFVLAHLFARLPFRLKFYKSDGSISSLVRFRLFSVASIRLHAFDKQPNLFEQSVVTCNIAWQGCVCVKIRKIERNLRNVRFSRFINLKV